MPLIVDIAIDDEGKQMHKVHKPSRKVQDETWTSAQDEELDKTPVSKLMSRLSPASLKQTKVKEEFGTSSSRGEALPLVGTLNSFKDEDENIWSEDVEKAFEETLTLIPKKGTQKIKVSGRCFGRNELISDYIYSKTGKLRTRKQVSSHIQVIKNMGTQHNIIKLINDGPTFENTEQEHEATKRFEDVFSKILFEKSLGFGQPRRRECPSSFIHHEHKEVKKFKRSKGAAVENFCFSIADSHAGNLLLLTRQDVDYHSTIMLKEGANISRRFPGLWRFQGTDVPITHIMVKIHLPVLPQGFRADRLQACYYLKELEGLSSDISDTYSVHSCIYSFGVEVLKFNDHSVKLNSNISFVENYWKFFIPKLLHTSSSHEIKSAFKGVTVKQIIYKHSASNGVSMQNIMAIFLWEFAGSDSLSDAVTCARKLVLPERFSNSASNLSPFYNDMSFSSNEGTAPPPPQTPVPQSDVQLKFRHFERQRNLDQWKLSEAMDSNYLNGF